MPPPVRPVRGLAASAAVALALIAGCASAPPETVSFRCEDGTRFALRVNRAGDRADIMFDGMTFGLRREDAATGTRYACDVLDLWTDGAAARLDIQGSLRQCRAAP